MTGFGRTGEWFAVNHWGVKPDIMTLAKGLTSAYAPLGVVAMQEEIAAFFNERVYHGGLTYNGHPISLAAAIANIEVIKEDKLVEKARETGEVMSEMLAEIASGHPSVGDVRSIGLFGAIELVKNQRTREPITLYNTPSKEMTALRKYSRDHGLYHYVHDNIILIIPPLIITPDQLTEGFAILSDALQITDAVIE
jgi:taurine--2-oxoglutarate transaminase